MTIYKFSTWGASNGKLFAVHEIEVEEKPKTYIGKGVRINKENIDKVTDSYGYDMYRLDNDPKPYIEAIIKICEHRVESAEQRLADSKKQLAKWKSLAERGGE